MLIVSCELVQVLVLFFVLVMFSFISISQVIVCERCVSSEPVKRLAGKIGAIMTCNVSKYTRTFL